ncbi:HEXXH motif domain-containing protein [Thermomonospora amylolytica]|uniref:HEXXH motif domain-containing protein n=1 Tax=Thermomonospora amylolytica TaxID=1411117 RepID=UPI000E6C66EF|nr:HEXXH motif domain-containing protein [Thermomonospora amylolytica]
MSAARCGVTSPRRSAGEPDRHRLPERHFDALAAGEGDRACVAMLRDVVLTKQLLRMCALADTDPAGAALLDRAQDTAPGAVAELLRYPHVVGWATDALRRSPGEDGEPGPGHLASTAAAAAVLAGLEATVDVPVRGGAVILPTLGRAQVGPSSFDGIGHVRTGPGGTEISAGHRVVHMPDDPSQDAPGWTGLRRLRLEHDGLVLDVRLDDLDPYRNGFGLEPAPRLSEEAVRAWRRSLDGAWAVLVRHHRPRAETIAAGVTTIVPLADQGGRHLSATSARAPGAIALTPPGEDLLLAESLVHEFQHIKLYALMDLFPLHGGDRDERFYAPWREDPRPLGGLIHGAYAFLGVTDFWRRQAEVAGDEGAAFAEYLFALWREETGRAIGAIEGSGRLTEVGRRFVGGMRAASRRLTAVPAADLPRRLAEDTAADHAFRWRLRHLRHDPATVDRIASAWPTGTPEPPARPAGLHGIGAAPPPVGDPRTDLRQLRLLQEEEFRRVRTADEADMALVAGDLTAAIDRYRARLRDDPADIDAWSGLAVAVRRAGTTPAAASLPAHPELVAAVHRRVAERSAVPPDPLEIAAWLAPATCGLAPGWTTLPVEG